MALGAWVAWGLVRLVMVLLTGSSWGGVPSPRVGDLVVLHPRLLPRPKARGEAGAGAEAEAGEGPGRGPAVVSSGRADRGRAACLPWGLPAFPASLGG
ncbi:hypothetical protein V8C86DRAFT_2516181 [Haematococcus lacustris]